MTTPLDIALNFIGRGWNPVPIEYRTKKPIGAEWQRRVIDASNAARFFNGAEMNIGVILGPTSHNLTDVDHDADEAICIGPYVLPRTKARFGRASKRDSHSLYYTGLSGAGLPAALAFDDPKKPKRQGRLIELRIGGASAAQTVLPGSVHQTGEVITWEADGEPATVDGDDLLRQVKMVAAYSLLARYWPAEGSGHHDTARVVGGLLARIGLGPETVRIHVEAIAKATNSSRWKELCRTAEDAAEAFAAGKHTFGFRGLREAFGADIADKAAGWLGYDSRGDRTHNSAAAQTSALGALSPIAEDTLALEFADRHADEVRYTAALARWLCFDGQRWQHDDTLHSFDRARTICREVAIMFDKSAVKIASAKTVAAVERLAKADRRLATTPAHWDADDADFNTNGEGESNGNV